MNKNKGDVKYSKRIQHKLEEIKNMSDEEILKKEKELYHYSGYNIIGGLVLLLLCFLGIALIVPYL